MIKRAVRIIFASVLLATNFATFAFANTSVTSNSGVIFTTQWIDKTREDCAIVHMSANNTTAESRRVRLSAFFNDNEGRQIGYNYYIMDFSAGLRDFELVMPAFALTDSSRVSDIANYYVLPSTASATDELGARYVLGGAEDSATQTDISKYSRYAYYIDKYDMDIVVNENGDLDVTEKISANFSKSRHGIVRSIPIVNTFDTYGKLTHRRAKIKNVSVDGDYYSTSRNNNMLDIKIGDADTLITGGHEYVIHYTYNLGRDPYENEDELYFNIIGSEWDAPIERVNFSIKLPKDFDANKVHFYSGSKGSIESDGVYFDINGRTISGYTTNVLYPGSALTIRQILDEGYFTFREPYEENPAVVLLYVIPIAMAVICIILWKLYGDDKIPSVMPTTQMPAELSCPQIALISRGSVNSDDVMAMLFKLANDGYIRIVDNPERTATYSIVRMRQYDGSNDIEREFMTELFKNATITKGGGGFSANDEESGFEIKDGGEAIITSSKLRNRFYRSILKIEAKTKREYRDKYYESTGNKMRIVAILLSIVCGISLMVTLAISSEQPYATVLFAGILAFYLIFILPIMSMKNGFVKIIMLLFVLGHMSIMCGGMLLALGYSLLDFEPFYLGAIIISVASLVICIASAVFMPKLNEQGALYYAQIKSYRDYLREIASTRISVIGAADMQAAYDILPYAFMFGLTAKWMKKFSVAVKEQAPDWYITNDGSSVDPKRFSSFATSGIATISHSPSSSGSGGSSSGGSSGGGSSGGGGGGGGGHSW